MLPQTRPCDNCNVICSARTLVEVTTAFVLTLLSFYSAPFHAVQGRLGRVRWHETKSNSFVYILNLCMFEPSGVAFVYHMISFFRLRRLICWWHYFVCVWVRGATHRMWPVNVWFSGYSHNVCTFQLHVWEILWDKLIRTRYVHVVN